MKINGKLTTLLAVAAALLVTSGCARYRKPIDTGSTGTIPGGGTDVISPDTIPGTGIAQTGAFKWDDKWLASSNWTRLPKVYFDYDRAEIRSSERGKMQEIAEYLKTSPTEVMLIAGHCDERGTAEYNRALGDRRANSAREYLVRLGINADRIATISYGKDRPADLGHTESAHARNRRAEFGVGSR